VTEESGEYVRIGQVIKPHGIDGELVVQPATDVPEERFSSGTSLTITGGNSDRSSLTVDDYRWHQGRILLETREINDRNEAEKFRDVWLSVPVSQDSSGEYIRQHELIQADVYDQDGTHRGTVEEVHPDEMNPLIRIDIGDDLIEFPLSPGLIHEFDSENRRLVLEFPDGWRKLIT